MQEQEDPGQVPEHTHCVDWLLSCTQQWALSGQQHALGAGQHAAPPGVSQHVWPEGQGLEEHCAAAKAKSIKATINFIMVFCVR